MRPNDLKSLACARYEIDVPYKTTEEFQANVSAEGGPESAPVEPNETQANVSQSQGGPEPTPNVSNKPIVYVKSTREDFKNGSSLNPAGPIPTLPTGVNPDLIKELQDEVKYLNVVIDKLEAERNALSLRMQEVRYFDKFNVAACKKWLLANYEFDRKDTPDLLTAIIENCMLQNDQVDILPHQLLIKNSLKAQKRRERDAAKKKQQSRSYKRQRIETNTITEVNSSTITTMSITPKSNLTTQKSSASKSKTEEENFTFEGEGNHYIPLQEIEELYASTPWQFLIDKISSTSSSKVEEQQQQPSSSSSASSTKGSRRNSSSPTTGATMIKNTLTEEEKQFIEKNACAIWERTHWFPIKCATGKNEEENRLIKWHHNRRKRRQARLKHDFDKALEEKKNETNMTIFNSRIYEKILLQKPRTWCPLEKNGHLIEQVVQLDQNEPDRLDCL